MKNPTLTLLIEQFQEVAEEAINEIISEAGDNGDIVMAAAMLELDLATILSLSKRGAEDVSCS